MELTREDYQEMGQEPSKADLSGSSFEELQPQATLVAGSSKMDDDPDPMRGDDIELQWQTI